MLCRCKIPVRSENDQNYSYFPENIKAFSLFSLFSKSGFHYFQKRFPPLGSHPDRLYSLIFFHLNSFLNIELGTRNKLSGERLSKKNCSVYIKIAKIQNLVWVAFFYCFRQFRKEFPVFYEWFNNENQTYSDRFSRFWCKIAFKKYNSIKVFRQNLPSESTQFNR